MITVTTPSRLHFGLLSLAEHGARWPDRAGAATLPARRFGGVGLMIDRPGVSLRVEPASAWSAEGPLAERVLAFAARYRQVCGNELPPQRFVVEHCAPEHAGFGAGTQLGLAVARALALVEGGELPIEELALRVGRGKRSAIGVHGFARGGFLVDGGQRSAGAIAPLLAHVDFPDAWRIVLVQLPNEPGVHGDRERAAFAQLDDDRARADALCRLVLLGMLPALAERDLAAFGAALGEFNARAGEAFASVQGGIYASPGVTEVVEFVRGEGNLGVGQSSWGPTVFAVVGDEESAAHLVDRLRAHGVDDACVTRADNHGAKASRTP